MVGGSNHTLGAWALALPLNDHKCVDLLPPLTDIWTYQSRSDVCGLLLDIRKSRTLSVCSHFQTVTALKLI